MNTEYLIIGLVILAGLTVGYTFFQEASQNNIKFNEISIDTNKSVPTDQGGSSGHGTSSDQGNNPTHRTSSDQGNNPSQGNICPTCGGSGYVNEHVDENGRIVVDMCPTCGGSGHL
ncbi:MAG TPA: hypothetical protein GXX31_07895 [Methanothermobacter sp.]|jgi:hypothetical protein|uniref:Molecular chaperone DnaJ n=1 Tax=Methanothermobacter tenebrarum TaxID=680118 RepID=A0ABM7YDK5_9EURY|nr:hypothetical protein [Methanothermobacter tenebrarum]MDX9693772.1 hypothetical protein [Methanothermobacter sp.]BDH80150.1 hypothetical protein MTTB_15290 [Methanothermobacter tenebrarum]HHW17259.1 hypothetical protein [Methanothermobacter sp.]HOQ20173.1 hypothetical protein [Methanothermobacter sp.]